MSNTSTSMRNTTEFVNLLLTRKLDFNFFYTEIWDEIGDIRTSPYLIRPWPILAIVLSYLAFVLVIGPFLMRKRQPFDLFWPMQLYNMLNVGCNGLMCIIGLYLTRFTYDCWGCQDINVHIYFRTFAGYSYMLLKIFDLLDTLFFIARKKYNQVTPLHVFHHAIMPIMTYGALKFAPNSNCALTLIVNTAVHAIMYSYYFLAALGPSVQKYLWWKKYITIIQIVQFVILFVQGIQMLLVRNCDHPLLMIYAQLFEAVFFMITFSNFYLKSYKKVAKVDSNSNGVEKKRD